MSRGRKIDNEREERRVFAVAVHYEQFSLGEIWERMKFVHYGRMSRYLLKWWREDGLTERLDKNGRWVRGDGWRGTHEIKLRFSGKAIYRWIE